MPPFNNPRYWPPHIINGNEIDLAHLEPFMLSCPTPDNATVLQINTRFSNHCFTEKFDQSQHNPALKVMDHKMPRAFDQQRYDLSKNLPRIIRALPMVKVHQTPQHRNYLYFSTLTELAEMEYLTFFSLKKADNQRHHLELFVESAYPSIPSVTPVPRRPNSIRFKMLAFKVYRGQPVRFAAR